MPELNTPHYAKTEHTTICQNWTHHNMPKLNKPQYARTEHTTICQDWTHNNMPKLNTPQYAKTEHTTIWKNWTHHNMPKLNTPQYAKTERTTICQNLNTKLKYIMVTKFYTSLNSYSFAYSGLCWCVTIQGHEPFCVFMFCHGRTFFNPPTKVFPCPGHMLSE